LQIHRPRKTDIFIVGAADGKNFLVVLTCCSKILLKLPGRIMNRQTAALRICSCLLGIVLPIVLGAGARRQVPGPQPSIAFEVASIRLHGSNAAGDDLVAGYSCHARDSSPATGSTINAPLGRCIFRLSLSELIGVAYASSGNIRHEVKGGPSWVGADRWDIQAKAENVDATERELQEMLRSLLADRFRLQIHREPHDVSGYRLVVARTGPKMNPDPSEKQTAMSMNSGTWKFERYGVWILTGFLESYVGGPVLDKTGLTGRYTFEFRPPPRQTATMDMATDSVTSIFAEVEDQLGLRLEPEEIPFETIVIDHAERPTPD
jgi:uncharacterized protein (TIGR03435 family)